MSEESSRRRLRLPPELEAQLRALDGNPDLIDIPEAPDENWAKARRFHAAGAGSAAGRILADDAASLRRAHSGDAGGLTREHAGAGYPIEPAKP